MAYALDTASLELIEQRVAELAPAWVYEFGPGRSTLVLAAHAGKVISFEQDPYWHGQMLETLEAEGVTNVEVRLAAAKDGSYDAAMPRNLAGFILIDGPRLRDGRQRTVEHVWPKVAAGGEVWVDDLHRTEVAGWLRRWEAVAGPIEPLTIRLGRFIKS